MGVPFLALNGAEAAYVFFCGFLSWWYRLGTGCRKGGVICILWISCPFKSSGGRVVCIGSTNWLLNTLDELHFLAKMQFPSGKGFLANLGGNLHVCLCGDHLVVAL